jgi:hypothetical protein
LYRDEARDRDLVAVVHLALDMTDEKLPLRVEICARPKRAFVRARSRACADLDAKRQFLRDHVEKMVFDCGRITITGSVPIQGAAPT